MEILVKIAERTSKNRVSSSTTPVESSRVPFDSNEERTSLLLVSQNVIRIFRAPEIIDDVIIGMLLFNLSFVF